MVRVLQVLGCLERGGTEAYVMNNFRNIDREKFFFDFLIFNNKKYPYDDEIRKLGGNIYYCTAPSIINIFKFFNEFRYFIKNYGPFDVIHSHIDIGNAWIMFVAKLLGVPITVSHSHSTFNGNGRKLYRKIQRKMINKYADYKLACSTEAGIELYGQKTFSENGIVANNGIDIDKFTSTVKCEQLKKEFSIKDEVVLGNISIFNDNKNQSYVIDVFYEFQKINPRSVLLLGGKDCGTLNIIKEQVRKLGISDKVRFIGVRTDVPDCLRLMDFYIFPSKYEGLGIIALEAQATGIYCFISQNVPTSVDMGLGLAEFLDINQKPEVWAKKIASKIGYAKPSNEDIMNAFKKKGYSIHSSIKMIEKIYKGERYNWKKS